MATCVPVATHLCGPLQVPWLLEVTVGASSTPLVQLVWLLLTLASRAIAEKVGAPTPRRHSAYTCCVLAAVRALRHRHGIQSDFHLKLNRATPWLVNRVAAIMPVYLLVLTQRWEVGFTAGRVGSRRECPHNRHTRRYMSVCNSVAKKKTKLR